MLCFAIAIRNWQAFVVVELYCIFISSLVFVSGLSQVSSHATLICCHPAYYSPGKTDNMMPHISLTGSQRTKAPLGKVGQKTFGLALESFSQSFLDYCKKKLNFHCSNKIYICKDEGNYKTRTMHCITFIESSITFLPFFRNCTKPKYLLFWNELRHEYLRGDAQLSPSYDLHRIPNFFDLFSHVLHLDFLLSPSLYFPLLAQMTEMNPWIFLSSVSVPQGDRVCSLLF